MPQPSIKKFAANYDILVEDVCSRDLHCVDVATPIEQLKSILEDTAVAWILTTSNGHIVGAVARASVLSAFQYSELTLNVGAFIECIPRTAHAKDALLSYGLKWSESTPLRVVEDSSGKRIGLLDKSAWNRVSSRYMLTDEDQKRLTSNPIINQISLVAKDLNIEVYIIGGWVRDFILNLPSKDLDFAVVGDAFELATILAEQCGGEVHRFKDFGGAHWVISETLTIDFTGARKEEYPTFGALPVVAPTHIERDLLRRDFSINAMAIAVHMNKLGLLLDPMNGLVDLDRDELRTLHSLSFLQDPTRIFRAARYSTRFNMTLHPATLLQMQQAITTIKVGEMLSLTRVGIELKKIFEEPHPEHCWKRLNEWGVWTTWQSAWSSITLHHTSTLSYPFNTEDWKSCWWMQLRLVLTDLDANSWKDVISIRPNGLKAWVQFPNEFQLMHAALQAVRQEHPTWKRQAGDALQKSTPVHWLSLECKDKSHLPILRWWIETGRHHNRQTTGDDVLELGVPKGPKIAELLTIAQHVAWEGGSKADEMTAIQTKVNKGP